MKPIIILLLLSVLVSCTKLPQTVKTDSQHRMQKNKSWQYNERR